MMHGTTMLFRQWVLSFCQVYSFCCCSFFPPGFLLFIDCSYLSFGASWPWLHRFFGRSRERKKERERQDQSCIFASPYRRKRGKVWHNREYHFARMRNRLSESKSRCTQTRGAFFITYYEAKLLVRLLFSGYPLACLHGNCS